MNIVTWIWPLLHDAFWSGVAALGFAVLFSVPVRYLLACAVCGATGYTLRAVLIQAGMSIEGATLVGAAAVGFLGILFARRNQAPTPIFTISGVIPMVPGRFAFGAMMDIIRFATLGQNASAALLVDAHFNAIKTALILGAIAAGIAAPGLLFYRPRPVV